MKGFRTGDVFAAYLAGRGYVGVGVIEAEARKAGDIKIGGKPLLELPLRARHMWESADDDDLAEFVCGVHWLKTVGAEEAAKSPDRSLFYSQLIRASLDNQPYTIEFVEQFFGVSMRDLAV